MLKKKLSVKSWGQQIKSKSKVRPVMDYRKCPYPSCQSDFGKHGVIKCVVGYDKDRDLLIACCPVCLHLSTFHVSGVEFRILEMNSQEGKLYKQAALEFLCYPETYDAMRQCINEVLEEYEETLKGYLKWLKSKLGFIPSVNYDPSWKLKNQDLGRCHLTAGNLDMIAEMSGIEEYEVKQIRRKITRELNS